MLYLMGFDLLTGVFVLCPLAWLDKRPGVTIGGRPGRGGEIRMRGLGNGYTQVLLNGERPPAGFSMDSLSPDQVERVEIMRGPVAEHSTQAIAGTINIVLREGQKANPDDLKLTRSQEHGEGSTMVNWVHNLKTEPVNGTFTLSGMDTYRPGESITVPLFGALTATTFTQGASVMEGTGGTISALTTTFPGSGNVYGAANTTATFVDPKGNWKTKAGSALLAAGRQVLHSTNVYFNQPPFPATDYSTPDIFGTTRPSSGNYDAGAFQFTGGSTPVVTGRARGGLW